MNWYKVSSYKGKYQPSNTISMIFDFYAATWLLDLKSHNDIFNQDLKDLKSDIISYVKNTLLEDLYFCILTEIRHVSYDNLNPLFENIKKYNNFLNVIEQINTVDNFDEDEGERGAYKEYDNAFDLIHKTVENKLDFVYFCHELFSDNSLWEDSFGGKLWAKIAKAWINLYNSKDDANNIVWIDHIFDLQHNSGFALNKIKKWHEVTNSDKVKKDILNIVLTYKRDLTHPEQLVIHCSPVVKKELFKILKEKYSITKEKIKDEISPHVLENYIDNNNIKGLIKLAPKINFKNINYVYFINKLFNLFLSNNEVYEAYKEHFLNLYSHVNFNSFTEEILHAKGTLKNNFIIDIISNGKNDLERKEYTQILSYLSFHLSYEDYGTFKQVIILFISKFCKDQELIYDSISTVLNGLNENKYAIALDIMEYFKLDPNRCYEKIQMNVFLSFDLLKEIVKKININQLDHKWQYLFLHNLYKFGEEEIIEMLNLSNFDFNKYYSYQNVNLFFDLFRLHNVYIYIWKKLSNETKNILLNNKSFIKYYQMY